MNPYLCRVIAAAAMLLPAPRSAAQADFPAKPIRLLHGFTAGGISDVLGRALGARLATSLGQQVVVDARPGAGTTIASEQTARAPADGYTLFLQDVTTHAINASLYRRLPYDSLRDFSPVTLIAATPLMLVVHPSLSVKSVQELVALAKKRPNEISFELVLYSGILAPRGVPRAVVDRLNAEFGRAVRSPEVQAVYARVGALPVTNTPEEFSAHMQSEMTKLGKLVQLAGARVE